MATPWRHPDTKVFYLYRQVPAAIRPIIGRTFWKASLHTREPLEAARLFTIANAALEQRFAAARLQLAEQASQGQLTPEQAKRKVDAFLSATATSKNRRWPSLALTWWLEDTADRHFGSGAPGMLPVIDETGRADAAAMSGATIVGERWLKLVRDLPVARWLDKCAFVLDPLFESLAPSVIRTSANEMALMDAWNLRVAVDLADVQAEANAGLVRPAKSRSRPHLRLRELLALWDGAQKPRPQTKHEVEQSVEDFIDWWGDVPVRTITKEMIYDYRDAGAQLPKAMPRADRELPFRERHVKHERSGAPRVSPATLKKRVGAIQTLLGFAAAECWITENAGAGVKIVGHTRAAKPRRSIRDGELTALFSSPLFTRPDTWKRAEAAVSGPTLYWLFLIGLTSGARLEEFGQARLADVQRDAGVLFIDIDDREIDATASEESGKSVKNDASRRVVPVHERLLSLGFERYCQGLEQASQVLLFPDLIAGQFGKRTKEASRVANRYIDKHVSGDRRLVFHGLRHKFKDEGRTVGVSDSVLDQIAGHAPATVGARYGDGVAIPALKRELDRLTFASVDWALLDKAAVQVDWIALAADFVTRMTEAKAA